jgi:putative dimethyl sulfoxide reductase chaperone
MTNQAEILQSRSNVYRTLQALCAYPLGREKVEAIFELNGGHSRLEEELHPLCDFLREVTDWDGFIEDLNLEYIRLFEGPGDIPAPPYASFYLNGGQLMGPETITVRRKYVTWGVAPIDMGKAPDDHIALELAFMGYLSDETSDALAEQDEARCAALTEAQIDFLGKHLLTWVPKFVSETLSAKPSEFFTRLSRFAQAYLEEDVAVLAKL